MRLSVHGCYFDPKRELLCFAYFTDISINLWLNKTAAPNEKMLEFLRSSISLHEIAILANSNVKIFYT